MGDKFRVCKVINGKAYLRRKCNECYSLDTRAYSQKQQKQLDKIKSKKKCTACGFNDWRALQYHHKRREEKVMNIGEGSKCGLEKTKKEIKKCICLCANCHQILHHEERKTKLLKNK